MITKNNGFKCVNGMEIVSRTCPFSEVAASASSWPAPLLPTVAARAASMMSLTMSSMTDFDMNQVCCSLCDVCVL